MQSIVAGCANLETAAQALITAQNSGALTAFWANSPTIDRASSTLASITAALNLTSAEIDALFVAAAKISL